MKFTPSRFWITTGYGESNISELNAIDSAFVDSGIGFQNHVVVSSIPPAEQIFPKIDSKRGTTYIPIGNQNYELPLSSIIHVVRSMKTGGKGDTIASCIALARVKIIENNISKFCIFAFESSGKEIKEVESKAIRGVHAMIEKRSVELDSSWENNGFKLISKTQKVQQEFGCVASFVVFDPFTYQ